ncbi:MAG: hypothetical protein FWH17_11430 [Oscillospiraceae bacterium]|nr:hypothetical protein [Oscillospiraceae bacterium]
METKVPFYNMVNILLPGVAFISACLLMFFDMIKIIAIHITNLESLGLEVLLTFATLAISYEVGYIIFRLGSTLIGPILRKLYKFYPYEKYVDAKKAGANKLSELSREFAYARTRITLFFLLTIVAIINLFRTGSNIYWVLIITFFICVSLFMLATYTYVKKIKTNIDKYLTRDDKSGVATDD